MQGRWRTRRNSTFSIVLILICTVFSYFGSSLAVAAPPIILQEVQFGQDELTAGRAVDITAFFCSNRNQTRLDGTLGKVQLLALSSDLQWLHIHPQQSAAATGDGTYSLVFDKVTFPTGGQYVLIFEGQLPDNAGKAQAVSISTLIGVAGEPANVHASYQRETDTRAGITDIIVHSIATTVHQQRSISLAELVSYPTTATGPAAGSASAHANSSSAANSSHTLAQPAEPQQQYRITLSTQGACNPGHATTYNWTFSDASTGAPVSDLQGGGGLDGQMPLVIVSSNLSFVLRTSASSLPGYGSKQLSTSISTSRSDVHGNIVEEQAALLTNSNTTPGGVVTSSSNAAGVGSAPQSKSGGRRMLQLLPATGQNRHLLQSNSVSSSANSSTRFGPTVSADVELPDYGTFLFVGEVSRGDDVIVVPFVVSCEPMQAAPVLPVAATNSAGFAIGARAAAYIWIVTLAIAICMQQLLL